MIVMVLLCRLKLFIVDEFIIVFDVIVQVQIMILFNELKCEFNIVIIMIIYDLGVVVGICDKVLVMYVGCIMEYGKVCDVFYQFVYLYLIGLFNVVLCLDSEGVEMLMILGNFFNLLCLFKGCLFQLCCFYVMEICNNVLLFEVFSSGCLCVCFKLVEELL